MPRYSDCGHSYQNRLEIPTVATFNINTDDVKVIRGSEGSKSISIKTGSFVSTINTIRVEYQITLHYIEKSVYTALKEFIKQDLLNYYLKTYRGSLTLDYNGEVYSGCVIKEMSLGPSSVKTPAPVSTDPDIEYMDSVTLRILAPEYRIS